MEPKNLIFNDKCIIKYTFNRCKELIIMNKVDTRKIVLSEKDSYGHKDAFKHFIGYIGNAGIIQLCIILPQINSSAECFKDSKCVNILVHDDEILKKI